ncbi:MAG: hypothetical protein ACRDJ9_31990, partial [Dehalococcoidia bacterium]
MTQISQEQRDALQIAGWTEEEAMAFAQTLATFRDGLPPRQRDAFTAMLATAGAAVSDARRTAADGGQSGGNRHHCHPDRLARWERNCWRDDVNEHDVQTARATLEQSATGLSPEEQAQPRLATQGTGVGPATADQTDVAGHMVPLYDDGFGNKGRPRPVEGTGGGGTPYTLGQIAIGFLGALALGLG